MNKNVNAFSAKKKNNNKKTFLLKLYCTLLNPTLIIKEDLRCNRQMFHSINDLPQPDLVFLFSEFCLDV